MKVRQTGRRKRYDRIEHDRPFGEPRQRRPQREFEETAEEPGMTSTTALTVFMKRFVEDGGFPFEVRRRVPSEREFVEEMDERYRRMRAGEGAYRDLVEA